MTEDHLAILVYELQSSLYDNLSADEGYAKLHSVTETTVEVHPVPLTIVGLLGVLSQSSIAKLVDWVHLIDLRRLVDTQDRIGVGIYVSMLAAAGKITSEEYTGVNAMLAATETVQITTPTIPRVATIFAGIESAPNSVGTEDFNDAWILAGRAS